MFVEKVWWYKKYQCSVVQTSLGHRCGYIAVPTDTKIPMEGDGSFTYVDLNVHGGVTLDEHIKLRMGTRKEYVGIVVGDDMRIIGFDCGHCYDAPDVETAIRRGMDIDYIHKMPVNIEATVRTQKYCEAECRNMVDQIIQFNS
jgi:hypothetical protein